MSVLVKYKGKLTFRDYETAYSAFRYLVYENEDTIFYVPQEYRSNPLYFSANLIDSSINIDYNGDCGYEEYYRTQTVVSEVVGLSKSGKVIFGTVKYEAEGWVESEIQPSRKLRKQILGE